MKADDPIKSKRVPRFVEEYAKDRNGTQAAIRAGYSENCADVTAARLLGDARVRKLVEAEIKRVSEQANFTAVDAINHLVELATADPSRITKIRRLNCRHCWGVNFGYQWKTREYAEACDRASRGREPFEGQPALAAGEMPKCDGGFGFMKTRDPNPLCPECEGDGVEDVFVADMSTLTGAERRLIAGLKVGKDGQVEVKFRDQSAALDRLLTHLGVAQTKKIEVTGKDGAPLLPSAIIVCGPDDE